MSQDAAGRTLLKLIDFGIAVDHAALTSVFKGGTLGYAAPEQWARTGKDLDGRTDLYGLGATMYRMLTGHRPFPEAQDIWSWIDAVKSGPPVDPSTLRRGVPPELSNLVLSMLALRPEHRPPNADAVIQELVRLPTDDTPKPLEVRVHPKDGLKYVWIPPGRFRMGASEGDTECRDVEKPAHEVQLTQGFWIGQTPVTVEAYKRFVKATGAVMPEAPHYNWRWDDGSLPMVNVSWEDAQGYCNWAGLRLPTEAQWEYAARGGSTGSSYGELDEIAWHGGNSGNKAHPVGGKKPNSLHLFDMLGNVWEWVSDWYDGYQERLAVDPPGPPNGTYRVLRGGSWNFNPGFVRASCRNFFVPAGRVNYIGFRCVGEKLVP